MNSTLQNPKDISSRASKAARAEVERALSFHFQGNKADALKALRKALALDPSLAREPLPSNLARELTGLSTDDALKYVTDGNASQAMIATAQRERRRTPVMRRQRVLFSMFAVLSLIFIGLLVWSVYDGTFKRMFPLSPSQVEKYSLHGYEYYVSVPRGSAPENGWPVVMAFHGYGGDAQHMVGLAGMFNEAGAILVAPTFGTYEPNPGNGPIEPASQILTEVGKQYPMEPRGAILFGFSQGGSFAYRFSVYYSSQVAAVVTAGAPELDAILPSRNIPYIFTWGELDDLQQFVLPSAYMIQNQGFNVRTAIVPGIGHEISRYSVDQVLMLLKQP